MQKTNFGSLAAALGLVLLSASVSCAGLWMAGDFQIAGGYSTGDWDAGAGPNLNDLGGGLYDFALTGLVANTRYQTKLLDDQGTPPGSWGDPEVPDNGPGSSNTWFITDASGNASISVDRNTYNDGLLPGTDRITFSTDLTEFPNLYATGSWMDEAGGAADWTNNDPLFEMTDQGSGLYSVDATISTPGSYEFKATAGSWDYQWGANGRLNDSSNFQFITVATDQEVTFLLDLSKGAIGYSTATFLDGDTNNDGVVNMDDFYPVRDNWLDQTYLRANGNLDNTGSSEGIVDISDFRQWKNAYASVPGAGAAQQIAAAFASLGTVAVPEPSSLGLAAFAGLGLIAGVRRRRRSPAARYAVTSERACA